MVNRDFQFPENSTKESILAVLESCKHPSQISFFNFALVKFKSEYPEKISNSDYSDIKLKFQNHLDNKWDEHLDLRS